MGKAWAFGLAVAIASVAASARAQPAASDPLASAKGDLDEALAASSASDCATACRALESMRRATDRICSLDPAESCRDARRKLGEATERVRARCPDCAAANAPSTPPAPSPPPPPRPDEAHGAPSAVSQEEAQKRGGCAGCAVGGAGAEGGALGALAIVLALVARRRNRKAGRREDEG